MTGIGFLRAREPLLHAALLADLKSGRVVGSRQWNPTARSCEVHPKRSRSRMELSDLACCAGRARRNSGDPGGLRITALMKAFLAALLFDLDIRWPRAQVTRDAHSQSREAEGRQAE